MVNLKTNLNLPNFCSNYALLLSLLVGQIVATCMWLLGVSEHSVASYGLWTLYVQSLVLLNCALLCWTRARLQRLNLVIGSLTLIALGASSILVLEYLANLVLPLRYDQSILNAQTGERMIVMALVYVLLLRLFSLLEILELRSKAEAQSRIHALQSKIQPHFLFNSLNTISELAATDSEQAENAIQALSMLFRVSLEESDDLHSLEKELRLCDRYLELESWRFDPPPRLSKEIDIKSPENCLIPKLLLQPLFENALKYGIASGLAPAKAYIDLSIKETASDISIKLSNSFKTGKGASTSHGLAIENTKERLNVLFGERQSFRVNAKDDVFHVIIKIPKSTKPKGRKT